MSPPVSSPSDTTFPKISLQNKARVLVNIYRPLKTEQKIHGNKSWSGCDEALLCSQCPPNPRGEMAGERSAEGLTNFPSVMVGKNERQPTLEFNQITV